MAEPTPVQIFHTLEKRKQYRSGSFFLKSGLLFLFLLVPIVFPSFKTVDLAMQIIMFATLVASFDILLGYTGILSFGHGMFFGIGAYCVAFLIGKYGMPALAIVLPSANTICPPEAVVIQMSPFTSRGELGLLVPMPTLPSFVICSRVSDPVFSATPPLALASESPVMIAL